MIDFSKIEKNIDSKIKLWINKATSYLKDKVDEKTPEDTFELIKNNKRELAKKEWDRYVWEVLNDTEYALYVEYGIWWEQYNYYKNSWRKGWWSPFYKWVWARMFTRTSDEEESEVYNIINKTIWI